MITADMMEESVEAHDVHKVREPKCFDEFRCIGADCEDTCCVGWGIPVDHQTYEKYQNLPGQRIGGRTLSSLVEINPARTSTGDYAKLRLDGASCPALQDQLCAIQQTLGEAHLPDLCSKYPRVMNGVGTAIERSLHLSCPEAARLVLSDPGSMTFREYPEERMTNRPGSVNPISDDPGDHLYQVRILLIELIRERSLPLWQRIVSLGIAVDRLAGVDMPRAAAVLEDYLRSLRQGSFQEFFLTLAPDPAFQLETILELVVCRIGTDYTSPRFLDCYRDLMHGLSWTPESTMEELAARYGLSARTYFLPFVGRNEHFLENYLISYIFRTVFPYRSKLPGQGFSIDSSGTSMRRSFVLLAVHYAIVRTMLIGMAARHKDELSVPLAIKLVQSYSKAFLHCGSFEAAAIEYLDKNVGVTDSKVAQLVMD